MPIDPGLLERRSGDDARSPEREPGTLTAGLRWDHPTNRAEMFLSEIARGSGGFAVLDRARFSEGLARLAGDLDHYYMLGFYPDEAGRKWRELQVLVNRPGVTLRFRRGYQLGAATKPPKNRDPMVGFASSVLPKTDLPLKMFATVLPSRGRTPRVAVTLQVRVQRRADGSDRRDAARRVENHVARRRFRQAQSRQGDCARTAGDVEAEAGNPGRP